MNKALKAAFSRGKSVVASLLNFWPAAGPNYQFVCKFPGASERLS